MPLSKKQLLKIQLWKIAFFLEETKEQIKKRDWYKCIFCSSSNLIDIHHVLFWSDTLINEDRNTVKNWVTVCRKCHTLIHWCRRWEWLRQRCIYYIKILFPKRNNE